MQQYNYNWKGEIFLLHIQLNNLKQKGGQIILNHEYDSGKVVTESIQLDKSLDSYRTMVTRTHPREKSFTLVYDKSHKLEVYELEDRAYYPTETTFAS